MRTIDADELSEHKFTRESAKGSDYMRGWNDAIDAIVDNAPSVFDCRSCKHNGNERECADCYGDHSNFVKYEERPQGYWKKDEWGNISCSNCGRDTRNPHYPFFCCFCGADMGGSRE